MYLRKKNRTRLLIFLVIVFGFILWRGLTNSTEKGFECEYKLVYAICRATKSNAKLPGLIDIIKAGVKF